MLAERLRRWTNIKITLTLVFNDISTASKRGSPGRSGLQGEQQGQSIRLQESHRRPADAQEGRVGERQGRGGSLVQPATSQTVLTEPDPYHPEVLVRGIQQGSATGLWWRILRRGECPHYLFLLLSMQSQKSGTTYLKSEQLLPFGFDSWFHSAKANRP